MKSSVLQCVAAGVGLLGAGGRIYSLHQAYASRASRCSKLTKPYVLDDHPLACMEAIIHGKNKHKVRGCS